MRLLFIDKSRQKADLDVDSELGRTWCGAPSRRPPRDSRGGEYDPIANKSIVIFNGRYFVTIGYTGVSYIQSSPTDEWLTRRILGDSYVAFGAITQGATRAPALHVMTETLLAAVDSAIAAGHIPLGMVFHLDVCGLRRKRSDQLRPYLYKLRWNGAAASATGMTVDLRHLPPRRTELSCIGNTDDNIIGDLQDRVVEARNFAASKHTMIDAVRRNATSPGVRNVGLDVTTVDLSWGSKPVIAIEYHPFSDEATEETPVHRRTGIAYSPMIIAPDAVMRPSAHHMPGGIRIGGGTQDVKYAIMTSSPGYELAEGEAFTTKIVHRARLRQPFRSGEWDVSARSGNDEDALYFDTVSFSGVMGAPHADSLDQE